jgi:hypothetical protein
MNTKQHRPWLQLVIRAMEHRKTLQQQTLLDASGAAETAEAQLVLRRSESTQVQQAWRTHLSSFTIDPLVDEGYRRYGLRAFVLEAEEKLAVERASAVLATEADSLRLLVGQSSAIRAVAARLKVHDDAEVARADVRIDDEVWATRGLVQGLFA